MSVFEERYGYDPDYDYEIRKCTHKPIEANELMEEAINHFKEDFGGKK